MIQPPETNREFEARFHDMPLEQKKSELRRRREIATPVLRTMLHRGDRIRATAARCGAHEATFEFSHWEGGWIVSKSGVSISPSSVQSVRGEVVRF